MTGLHSASQAGPATFPSLYLDANGLNLGQPAQLDLEFERIPQLACDFDGDGQCAVSDINLLFEQGNLVEGVEVGESRLDLTQDGLLSTADRDAWLTHYSIASINGLHRVGDANLDGVVDALDRDVWSANRYTFSNHWDQGDLNGDGLVDGSDFNLWNAAHVSQGSLSQEALSVPEPSFGLWVSALFVLGFSIARTNR